MISLTRKPPWLRWKVFGERLTVDNIEVEQHYDLSVIGVRGMDNTGVIGLVILVIEFIKYTMHSFETT
jgi:hypothetical protein